MNEVEMIDRMREIIGPDDLVGVTDELLLYYIDQAAERILNRRYPFRRPACAKVEPQYKELQLEAAIILFNKRGIEAESLHSENGVSRSYGGEQDLPIWLMAQITPKGMVV